MVERQASIRCVHYTQAFKVHNLIFFTQDVSFSVLLVIHVTRLMLYLSFPWIEYATIRMLIFIDAPGFPVASVHLIHSAQSSRQVYVCVFPMGSAMYMPVWAHIA